MKANSYRLKPGTTIEDIIKIPGIERQEHSIFIHKESFEITCFRSTKLEYDSWGEFEISINVSFDANNIEKWDDYYNVTILDEDFLQPYTPFYMCDYYKKEVTDFPALEWCIDEYNKFMDSIPVLEKIKDKNSDKSQN